MAFYVEFNNEEHQQNLPHTKEKVLGEFNKALELPPLQTYSNSVSACRSACFQVCKGLTSFNTEADKT